MQRHSTALIFQGKRKCARINNLDPEYKMEQRIHDLQVAHEGAKHLADRRAMVKQAQRPQMLNDEIAKPANEIKGGGEAGLARVVGAGKRRGRPRKAVAPVAGSDGEMCGGAAHMQGKMLGDHLMGLHGKGFFDDFAKGFMSVISPVAKVASFIPGPIGAVAKGISALSGGADKVVPDPQGTEISHARMSSQQMVPGAVAPVAYGNAPQAPESFRRNTVGMGRRKAAPQVVIEVSSESEEEEKPKRKGKAKAAAPAGDKRKSRGAMISKLMRENGMTLPQASRYIKEHGM